MKRKSAIIALTLCVAVLMAVDYATLSTGSKCCPAGKTLLLLAEDEDENENGENGNGNGKEEKEEGPTGLDRIWDVVMLG